MCAIDGEEKVLTDIVESGEWRHDTNTLDI
jgi:hypothetical protein